MPDKLIRFLQIQSASCRYISFPRTKEFSLAPLFWLCKKIQQQSQSRLFIMKTLANSWHLALGISQETLPSKFRAMVVPFAQATKLDWAPAFHLCITSKAISIELAPDCVATKIPASFKEVAAIFQQLTTTSEVNFNATADLGRYNLPSNLLLKPSYPEFKEKIELFTKPNSKANHSSLKKVVFSRSLVVSLKNTIADPALAIWHLALKEAQTLNPETYFFGYKGLDNDPEPFTDGFVDRKSVV